MPKYLLMGIAGKCSLYYQEWYGEEGHKTNLSWFSLTCQDIHQWTSLERGELFQNTRPILKWELG